MTNSKDYYSKLEVAKNYDKERFSSKAGQMFDIFEKDVVISNLPKKNLNIKILDAGAGTGRFTIELAKKGLKVVSSDYSNSMLNVVKLKVEENDLQNNVTLSKQDITKLTFDDEEFDYICCMRVLVNLDTKENLIKALGEFKRVCKPGGTIVLDIVNPKSIASFGSKNNSYVTLDEFKDMISSFPELKIKECFGRRILSQTAFEKAPSSLLGLFDTIDKKMSKLLPLYCVRIYFIIKKVVIEI
jgi:ubiquinone/menaquinone biosynthesis C-methylase UbiE